MYGRFLFGVELVEDLGRLEVGLVSEEEAAVSRGLCWYGSYLVRMQCWSDGNEIEGRTKSLIYRSYGDTPSTRMVCSEISDSCWVATVFLEEYVLFGGVFSKHMEMGCCVGAQCRRPLIVRFSEAIQKRSTNTPRKPRCSLSTIEDFAMLDETEGRQGKKVRKSVIPSKSTEALLLALLFHYLSFKFHDIHSFRFYYAISNPYPSSC